MKAGRAMNRPTDRPRERRIVPIMAGSRKISLGLRGGAAVLSPASFSLASSGSETSAENMRLFMPKPNASHSMVRPRKKGVRLMGLS